MGLGRGVEGECIVVVDAGDVVSLTALADWVCFVTLYIVSGDEYLGCG